MNIIVFIFGLLILIAGILLLIAPNYFKNFFKKFLEKDWIFFAVTFRIILGVCFIVASEQTRYPGFFYWFGILILLVAIILPIIDQERLSKFIKMWLDFPNYVTFILTIIGFLLDLFIMYSANYENKI